MNNLHSLENKQNDQELNDDNSCQQKKLVPCTVVILTHNSEKTLKRCLESVSEFNEIIILDGKSTDATIEIALKYGCKIFSQSDETQIETKIFNFSTIRNRGRDLATNDWILDLDSDEIVSKKLVEEIRKVVSLNDATFFAYQIQRKYLINEVTISRASNYPIHHIRLHHRFSRGGYTGAIHEKFIFANDVPVEKLAGEVFSPLSSPKFHFKKWKKYLELEKKMWQQKNTAQLISKFGTPLLKSIFTTPLKILFIRIKKGGQVLPLAYEIYRYIFIFVRSWSLIKFLLNLDKKSAKNDKYE